MFFAGVRPPPKARSAVTVSFKATHHAPFEDTSYLLKIYNIETKQLIDTKCLTKLPL
jgi:hypothetical protein